MNSDSEASDEEAVYSDFNESMEDDDQEENDSIDDSEMESENTDDEDLSAEENETEKTSNSEIRSSESEIENSDNGDDFDTSFAYSAAMRDQSSNVEKGEAVLRQLNLCEKLLESRIKLQKPLLLANQLPRQENFKKIVSQYNEGQRNTITECRETISNVLETMIGLQCTYRSKCPEFMETLDENTRKEYEEYTTDFDNSQKKRRTVSEYSILLKKLHDQYKSHRMSVLQEWTDKTRIASGKLAKKDFSGFDDSVEKQIENIMADKQRLIRRTQLKRSSYKIIGENDTKTEENDGSTGKDTDYDKDIYDDDDFYHKLLRDYIEAKTADETDPTQLGRKWIKLQSLRNKMKRKIDTRVTKERKIKFIVHNKLVNYMAPVTTNSWTDNATNELYSSVFGATSS